MSRPRGESAAQQAQLVRVARPGVARARNSGAAAGSGEILLFLDDDVHPPPHWLADLARPVATGKAAATVSLFRMTPGSEREWMSDVDRGALVSEVSIDPERPWLASGSIAIARSAFERCGGFEEELGPGALGSGGEDLLLDLPPPRRRARGGMRSRSCGRACRSGGEAQSRRPRAPGCSGRTFGSLAGLPLVRPP